MSTIGYFRDSEVKTPKAMMREPRMRGKVRGSFSQKKERGKAKIG